MVSDKDMSSLSEFPTYDEWTNPMVQTGKAKLSEKLLEIQPNRRFERTCTVQRGCVKSTVRCDAATLKDNAKQAGSFDEDQQIPVPTDGFKVTGILIGGQPASVDWQYEPTSSETFANTIYDKEMNGSMYAKHEASASNANYTLVFDNKKSDPQSPVYVTIELETTQTRTSTERWYHSEGC